MNLIKWRELSYGDMIYLLNNDNLISTINIEKLKSNFGFSVSELNLLSQIPQKKVVLTASNREKIYHIINENQIFFHAFKNILHSNTIPYTIHELLKEI